MLAMLAVFMLMRGFLPTEAGTTLASVAGGWIGGTANMVAVSQALVGKSRCGCQRTVDRCFMLLGLGLASVCQRTVAIPFQPLDRCICSFQPNAFSST